MIKFLPVIIILSGLSYGYHFKITSDLKLQVQGLTENNRTLKDNNSILKTTSDKNASEAKRLEQQNKEERERITSLERKFRVIEDDNKLMGQIFKEHDLSKSARRHPDLIEKLVNKATETVFNSVVDASNEVLE